MRRLFYLLIVLAYTLGSCTDNDKEIDNPAGPEHTTDVTLDISTIDLIFEASGGKKEFTIYCKSDWTITNSSSWCKMDVTNGNGEKAIAVTADVYTGTEDRNTNLTIKASDKTKVLTITQKQKDAIILTKDKFDVSQEENHISIEVKSNVEYQVAIPASFQGWIKQAVESKALTAKNFSFTISANENLDKREGYIVFSGNSLKDTVYVYQAQKNQLILTEDTYNVPAEGKNIAVQLRTNVDYDVVIPDSVKTWVSLIQTKAVRTDQLHFSIAESETYHDRRAIVIIKDKNSDLRDSLTIIQGALRLVADTYFLFSYEIENKTLIVNTKATWQASTNAEWCKINQQKDSLHINVDANLTNKERTAIVTVTSGGYSEKLSIKQAAYPEEIYLKCSVDSIRFSSGIDSTFLNIETNYLDWEFTINQTWCKAIKEKDNSRLKIKTMSENYTLTDRQAIVTVSAGNLTKKIKIRQLPKTDLSISVDKLSFECTQGTQTITVESRYEWFATVADNWCKISQMGNKLQINVAESPKIEKRTTTITIFADSKWKTVTITQAGVKLQLSVDKITLNTKGESKTIGIDCPLSYDIIVQEDWCIAEKVTNGIKIGAQENFRSNERQTVVIIKAGELEKKIIVQQEALEHMLIVSEEKIFFKNGYYYQRGITGNEGSSNQEKILTVDCDTEWNIIIEGTNSEGISVLKDGNSRIKIQVTPTRIARKLTFTIRSEFLEKTIEIIQARYTVGDYFNLGKLGYNFYDGNEGIVIKVFDEEGNHGLVVHASDNGLSSLYGVRWGICGLDEKLPNSNDYGKNNTYKIASKIYGDYTSGIRYDYYAFIDFSTQGSLGIWFMPDKDLIPYLLNKEIVSEIENIFNAAHLGDVHYDRLSLGGKLFWTSTQYSPDETYAACYSYKDGFVLKQVSKEAKAYVFQITEF